jgi:type I restriction enzyme S subunit
MNKGAGLGWDAKTLGAVSAINYGYTESASYKPVGPRFLRITDLQDDSVDWDTVPYCKIQSEDLPKYRLANGDIVFARTGATTGKSFLVRDPPEAVFASYLIRLRLLEKKLLPEFVSLFFQTSGYWKSIKDGSSGSAQGGFNATKLGALSIPIPPLPEQQRIVGILDEAFDGIATAKAHAEKNLQSAHALFESHLQSVFTQRREEWVEQNKPLADLCELIVDCEHKTAPTQEEGFPSIRTPNIGRGKLLLDGVYRVSKATYTEWTRRAKPRAGDLVLAREAPAGNVAVIPDNLPLCLGQRTVLIRPRCDVFDSEFLVMLLLQPGMRGMLLAHSRGATVQHVNMKDIRALNVGAIPSVAVQRLIVSKVNRVSMENERLISIYQQKLLALDALKKSLLHQAFTGVL